MKRVKDLGYSVKVSDAAKEFLTEKGYDPQYGARPLKRAIQKYLEDELAEVIIKGNVPEGEVLEVDCDKEHDKVVVRSELVSYSVYKKRLPLTSSRFFISFRPESDRFAFR